MKKILPQAGLFLVLGLLAQRGFSQTDSIEYETNKLQELKPITISVTRTKAKEEDLPQQVQVITANEIEQSGSKDLTDVLKKRTGVDVIQYPGLLSGIGIRGYRPQFSGLNQRSLLLIDGRPGATNLSTIDLDNIERIEVMKGASSALYGSQAMGGVVNVITKKSTDEIRKKAYVSLGSYNTLELGFNAGGSIGKKLDFDLNLKHLQQGKNYRHGSDNLFRNHYGWDEAPRTYYNADGGVDSVNTTNDIYGDGETREFTKYQYQSGKLRFGYKLSDNWRADISGDFFSASNVQAPGDYFYGTSGQSLKNPYRYGSDLSVEGKIKNNHTLTIRGYNSIEYADYRRVNNGEVSGFVTSKRTNKWKGLQVQDNYTFGDHNITYGLDYNRSNTISESFNSSDGSEKAPNSPDYGIYSAALYAQGYLIFLGDKLHVTFGARMDNVTFDVQKTEFLATYKAASESYNVFNPSVGMKYDLPKKFNVHASAGRAFVTPDAYNVAGYAVSGPGREQDVTGRVNVSYGNPDLKPETGITVDGGIGYLDRKKGLSIDVTYFNTNVSDRITLGQTETRRTVDLTDDGDTIASKTTYINADKAVMSGIESSVSWDLGAMASYDYSFKLFVNAVKYIQLEERIRNTAFTEEDKFTTKKVYNVADLTLTYGLEFTNDKFKTRLAGRYVGVRYDTDWTDYITRPEIGYTPFMLLDFSLGFPIKSIGELSIQVNNLTDENYYEKRGFNMPGRNMRIKLTCNF